MFSEFENFHATKINISTEIRKKYVACNSRNLTEWFISFHIENEDEQFEWVVLKKLRLMWRQLTSGA